MPTKPKKKSVKVTIQFPKPKKRPFPPGFKPMRVEEILGKGKDLWKSDEELDEFLELIRKMRQD
jgi:hypothetical protein